MPTNRNRPKPPARRNSGAWYLPSSCPGCSEAGSLVEKQVASIHEIRGEEVSVDVPKYVCVACECAFMSPAQATEGIKIAVAAYQRGHDLLTAAEVKAKRQELGISTERLAEKASVGVATIKRLEAGVTVQQASTDALLRAAYSDEELGAFTVTISDVQMTMGLCDDHASNWIDPEDEPRPSWEWQEQGYELKAVA